MFGPAVLSNYGINLFATAKGAKIRREHRTHIFCFFGFIASFFLFLASWFLELVFVSRSPYLPFPLSSKVSVSPFPRFTVSYSILARQGLEFFERQCSITAKHVILPLGSWSLVLEIRYYLSSSIYHLLGIFIREPKLFKQKNIKFE